MSEPTYPVIWQDSRYGRSVAGKLSLLHRHAVLAGASGGEPRVTEFEASEVVQVTMAPPSRRLHMQPTLVVDLRGRGEVLIAQIVGFGGLAEVADILRSWLG